MGFETSKLSPEARKAIIRGGEGDEVQALVELAPGFSPESLDVTPQQLEATILGWSEASRTLSLSIDPAHLTELAGVRGVTYIQVGSSMRLSHGEQEQD